MCQRLQNIPGRLEMPRNQETCGFSSKRDIDTSAESARKFLLVLLSYENTEVSKYKSGKTSKLDAHIFFEHTNHTELEEDLISSKRFLV